MFYNSSSKNFVYVAASCVQDTCIFIDYLLAVKCWFQQRARLPLMPSDTNDMTVDVIPGMTELRERWCGDMPGREKGPKINIHLTELVM